MIEHTSLVWEEASLEVASSDISLYFVPRSIVFSFHRILWLSLICGKMEVRVWYLGCSSVVNSQRRRQWSNASQLPFTSPDTREIFCFPQSVTKLKYQLASKLWFCNFPGKVIGKLELDREQSRTTVRRVFSAFQVWERVNEAEQTVKTWRTRAADILIWPVFTARRFYWGLLDVNGGGDCTVAVSLMLIDVSGPLKFHRLIRVQMNK